MLKRFFRDARGSLPVMTAVLAVPSILIAGAGIDFMHHETVRTRVQDSLDRGVLAAASLKQSQGAEQTIRSFLATSGFSDYTLTVREESQVNRRSIEADLQLSVETSFLGLAGIDDIVISATSSAAESQTNVEIALLLDMSGSMVDNGGIHQLRPAARDFIDAILEGEDRRTTSVNLIPFAGEVSVGTRMFNHLAGLHYSHRRTGVDAGTTNCFVFPLSDYNIGVPVFANLRQAQQYTWFNKGQQPHKEPWWCPGDHTAIRFLQNDPAVLKKAIDDLKVHDGTGTAIAMKWAAMSLNSDMRPALNNARTNGTIDTPFTTRPASFNDPETKKFLVLMTDGVIGPQLRPRDPNADKVYRYLGEMQWQYGKEDLSWEYARLQLLRLCRDLKTNGVEIYTIGFKLHPHSSFHADLTNCASRPENYHAVDGLDINDAFQAIAIDMKHIRLTR